MEPDADDTGEPAVDTALTDGLAIAYVDVEVKTITEQSDISFRKTTASSDKMDKGTEKVTTKAVAGLTSTNSMTAVHKSLPFNTKVKVTNLANGKSAVVRINDRGPYISGRCLDLSTASHVADRRHRSGRHQGCLRGRRLTPASC